MAIKNIVVCAEIENVSWRWIASHFTNSYYWSFSRAKNSNNILLTMLFRFLASLKAVAKSGKADVIVSHGPYMAFYCSFLIWLFRIKVPHVVYSFNFAVLPTGMALKRMAFFFQKIDCLVVSSTMERSLYAEYFNIPIENIDFIRWGVAEPKLDVKPRVIDKPYVSTVGGNARDYKTFMAAMAELPEVQAVAVMRPHNLNGLDVPANVKVLTNIPLDEALSIIKHSVCMVLPLVGSEVPCGHVTIVVAMYLGVPCLVTDSSGVSDYVRHEETGLLSEVASVVSMKESIKRLMMNNELSSKLSEGAGMFVRESCGEKNYVSHLAEIIKRVRIDEK